MNASDAEYAKVVRDLLVVAKVAMPPSVFAADPRVAVAINMLKELEAGLAPARPPNITSRPPRFDIGSWAQTRAVEESSTGVSFVTDLPWDLVLGVTKGQSELLPFDPSDAVSFIARDWLTSHGYLEVVPEDLA